MEILSSYSSCANHPRSSPWKSTSQWVLICSSYRRGDGAVWECQEFISVWKEQHGEGEGSQTLHCPWCSRNCLENCENFEIRSAFVSWCCAADSQVVFAEHHAQPKCSWMLPCDMLRVLCTSWHHPGGTLVSPLGLCI